MPPSDKTAIQCVIEVDQERIRLEKEAEILATKEDIGKTSSVRNHISTVPFRISFLFSLDGNTKISGRAQKILGQSGERLFF